MSTFHVDVINFAEKINICYTRGLKCQEALIFVEEINSEMWKYGLIS